MSNVYFLSPSLVSGDTRSSNQPISPSIYPSIHPCMHTPRTLHTSPSLHQNPTLYIILSGLEVILSSFFHFPITLFSPKDKLFFDNGSVLSFPARRDATAPPGKGKLRHLTSPPRTQRKFTWTLPKVYFVPHFSHRLQYLSINYNFSPSATAQTINLTRGAHERQPLQSSPQSFREIPPTYLLT